MSPTCLKWNWVEVHNAESVDCRAYNSYVLQPTLASLLFAGIKENS